MAQPSEVLTYEIELSGGPGGRTVDLVDPIPANATYISGTALVDGVFDPAFSFDSFTNSLTWLGDVERNDKVVLSFQVEVGLEADPVINVVEVTVDEETDFAAASTQVEGGGMIISVDGDCPGAATVAGVGATPNGLVRAYVGAWPGTSMVRSGGCAGTELMLSGAVAAGPPVRANSRGEFEGVNEVRPRVCGARVQVLDLSTCATSNTAPLPNGDNGDD